MAAKYPSETTGDLTHESPDEGEPMEQDDEATGRSLLQRLPDTAVGHDNNLQLAKDAVAANPGVTTVHQTISIEAQYNAGGAQNFIRGDQTNTIRDGGQQQPQAEEEDIVFPKGAAAIPFYMPYNILTRRIIERLDGEKELLGRMKHYCCTTDRMPYGVPPELLPPIVDGTAFLNVLSECGLLGVHNLLYLEYLLLSACHEGSQCADLIDDIQEYAEKAKGKDVLFFKRQFKSKAKGALQVQFTIVKHEVHGDPAHFVNSDAHQLQKILTEQLGIPSHLIQIIGAMRSSLILVIQMPLFWQQVDIAEKLQNILNQKPAPAWIKDFNIIEVFFEKDSQRISFGQETSEGDKLGAKPLRLVMVGMTGTGKSSLGNSLLAFGLLLAGQVWTIATKPFLTKMSPELVTCTCKKQTATVLGRVLEVVDTPGFIDTITTRSKDEVITQITKCLMEVAPGPHAILLVVKLGRITKEIVEGITMMKKMFGKESINFLIIVFTHIDDLEDYETLEGYVDKMTGSPGQLIKECEKRYVGFNNKYKPTSEENKEQVERLLSLVEQIARNNGGRCYTQALLDDAMRREGGYDSTFERIRKTVMEITGRLGCFASDSKVHVQDVDGNIRVKSLKDLVVGDLVQSYDPNTFTLTYSPVYYIIYQDDNDLMASLRELYYEGRDGKQHSIRLQGKHLIYASCGPLPALKTELTPSTPVMSEKVNVGDILWVALNDTGELYPRRVLKIKEIVANVRHPMTMNHTIVVDGVLASVHMHNERLLRIATAPLRLLYKISPRLSDFWLSKKAVQVWDYVEYYLL